MSSYIGIFVGNPIVPIIACVSMLSCLAGFYTQRVFKQFAIFLGGAWFIGATIVFTNSNGNIVGIKEALQALFYAMLGLGLGWFVDNLNKKKDYQKRK